MRPRSSRLSRSITSTITRAWFQRTPHPASISSSPNSSATLPIKWWWRCFAKCKAIPTLPITPSGSPKPGVSGKRSAVTAWSCSFSFRIRKMFIQVGYGLEGALPDVTAFDITEYRIKPHFRKNDYEGGLAAGIDSIFKAVRGEYKGTGKTKAEGHHAGKGSVCFLASVILRSLRHFSVDETARPAWISLFELGRAICRRAGPPDREAAADGPPEAEEDLALAAAVSEEAARGPVGSVMRTKDFLNRLEHDRIVDAIRAAEAASSAEIRVYIERGRTGRRARCRCQEEIRSARHAKHSRPQRSAHFHRPANAPIRRRWRPGDPPKMRRLVMAGGGGKNAGEIPERKILRGDRGRDWGNWNRAGRAFPEKNGATPTSCQTTLSKDRVNRTNPAPVCGMRSHPQTGLG